MKKQHQPCKVQFKDIFNISYEVEVKHIVDIQPAARIKNCADRTLIYFKGDKKPCVVKGTPIEVIMSLALCLRR